MKVFLFLGSFFLFGISLFGQNAGLEVNLRYLNREDTLVLKLSREDETYNEYSIATESDSLIAFRNLAAGAYILQLTTKSDRETKLYIDYLELIEN